MAKQTTLFSFKFMCRDDSDDITDTACVSDSGDGKTVTCKQKTSAPDKSAIRQNH